MESLRVSFRGTVIQDLIAKLSQARDVQLSWKVSWKAALYQEVIYAIESEFEDIANISTVTFHDNKIKRILAFLNLRINALRYEESIQNKIGVDLKKNIAAYNSQQKVFIIRLNFEKIRDMIHEAFFVYSSKRSHIILRYNLTIKGDESTCHS